MAKRPLISEEEIQNAVKRIANQISYDYRGKPLVIIAALKGAFIFVADLVRALSIDCSIEFVSLSSYRESNTSGSIEARLPLSTDISGKDVVFVDDILDTGRTLEYVMTMLRALNPATVKLCVMLDKPERRIAAVSADYVGFTIRNVFVVGYGMDYAETYRSLPYIAAIELRD